MPRYFYDCIRKTILAVADEFKDIKCHRQAKDGTEAKIVPVELLYGSKDKFYRRLQRSSRSTQIVLPAIALNVEAMNYDVSKQKNPLSTKNQLSALSLEHTKTIGSPSPVNLTFILRIKTKFYSDMMQILETIIPRFQPKITKPITLVPELGITNNINIILESITTNFENELDESPDSIRSLEADLSFEVETLVYPPSELKDIANMIKTNEFTITSTKSPSDIIDNKLLNMTENAKQILKIETLNFKETNIHRINISDIIASHGEFLSIEDKEGECSFVFEYDNDECYGKDYLVPEQLSLNKTGWIFIKTNQKGLQENDKIKISIWSRNIRNNAIPEQVFFQYADFNYRTLHNLRVERTKEIDVVYSDGGFLHLASPGTTRSNDHTKVFFKNDYSNFNKCKIAFVFPTLEEDEMLIVCGVLDSENNEIKIKTDGTDFIVEENGTEIANFNSSSRKIIFEKEKLIIGTEEIAISEDYFRFWLGTAGNEVMKYDLFCCY